MSNRIFKVEDAVVIDPAFSSGPNLLLENLRRRIHTVTDVTGVFASTIEIDGTHEALKTIFVHARLWDGNLTEYTRLLRGESIVPRSGCCCSTCAAARRILLRENILPEEES